MRGCLKGCLGSVGLLVVVTAVAYAGWRWGDPIFPGLERLSGVPTAEGLESDAPPSPDIAQATLDRYEAFQAGRAGERAEFESYELTSVLRYALPGVLPPGVGQPDVRLRDDRVHLTGRMAVSAFPDLPSFDEVVGLLPDTVDLAVRGTVLPFDDGHVAFQVDRIEASRVPLPGRMIPGVLRALGRTDREGLPETALLVPMPEGVERVFVAGDRLVLLGGS